MPKVFAREVIENLRLKKGVKEPDWLMYITKINEFVDYAVRNMQKDPQGAEGALRGAQSFLRTFNSLLSRKVAQGYSPAINMDQRRRCRYCQHPKADHKWFPYSKDPNRPLLQKGKAQCNQCGCLEFME